MTTSRIKRSVLDRELVMTKSPFLLSDHVRLENHRIRLQGAQMRRMRLSASDILENQTVDLTDDDTDVEMESKELISPSQKKQVVDICQSSFGRKFQKPHAALPQSLSNVLEMMDKNCYSSLEVAAGDAMAILDEYIDHFTLSKFFEDSDLDVMILVDKDEVICMAEHLKTKFSDLLSRRHRLEEAETALTHKLLEIFPKAASSPSFSVIFTKSDDDTLESIYISVPGKFKTEYKLSWADNKDVPTFIEGKIQEIKDEYETK